MAKLYRLIGPDGRPYASETPGRLGGYKPKKLYGRLDCPSAAMWLAKGHYARHRVFFADEVTAISAGYIPCNNCMPERRKLMQANEQEWRRTALSGGAHTIDS